MYVGYILHKMDTVNYNITDGELGGSLRNSVIIYLTPGSLHGSGVVTYLTPGSRQTTIGRPSCQCERASR